MEPPPASMSMASRAGATPLLSGLPEDIVLWEILVRLPPTSLLRCRAVNRAWRRATSTRRFLLAHHGRQPCLPIVYGSEHDAWYINVLAFDHRAADAQLQPVVRLQRCFNREASCDGLLILSEHGRTGARFSVCNLATRQHAPLRQLSGFTLLGMYPHRSTGVYRLLLQRIIADQTGCYVFALGSDQPPRYIGRLEAAPSATTYLRNPALVLDSLHWYPIYHSDPKWYQIRSKVLIVFDTTSESFRHMPAPVVPANSYVFEMDGTLGIYSHNDDTQIVDIWMLQDYRSEDWSYKYRVKLPIVEMKEPVGVWLNGNWHVSVHWVDGDVLLLVNRGGLMFQVDTNGKLVDSFRRDGQHVYTCQLRLKQTLVPHTFFTKIEGYAVNASPFV